MNHKSIRVRFAPSPTGHLHIGGLRAALFNWLFARHNKGTFLLRIEDTDVERSKDEYTKALLEALEWADVISDEPIVIQSERIQEHRSLVADLLKQGKAYYCTCTTDDLHARLKEQGHDVLFTKYDGYCRTRNNQQGAVRFSIPDDITSVEFDDVIRGHITVGRDQLDDFIIMRTDGTPMYNFVVVADDAFMKISHVIRGEEHISNTPKQILLYHALGYELPIFAHLPLILGPDGNKLSKRDAATAVVDYKSAGYLPDALVNYLVRLGWAHGDQEIFSRSEMIDLFTLEAVSKKGAIFDHKKLDWLNASYIRNTDNHALLDRINSDVDTGFSKAIARWSQDQMNALLDMYKQRSHTLKELVQQIVHVASLPREYVATDVAQWITPEIKNQLPEIAALITQHAAQTDQAAQAIKDWCKQHNVKLVAIMQPLRIAMIGSSSGPGVFDLMAVLGTQETVNRINALINYLNNERSN
ncbi:glutamate--tRNA ligase [Candidatus Dependentiae bacterium Noda2021]|nr:glutamate--tRNA ligase [Candidatus Dependentiae bacterium Noda2021]